jgi:hypothetical protein
MEIQMPKYTFKVSFMYSDVVTIEADTFEEAQAMAPMDAEEDYEYYHDCELIWTDED